MWWRSILIAAGGTLVEVRANMPRMVSGSKSYLGAVLSAPPGAASLKLFLLPLEPGRRGRFIRPSGGGFIEVTPSGWSYWRRIVLSAPPGAASLKFKRGFHLGTRGLSFIRPSGGGFIEVASTRARITKAGPVLSAPPGAASLKLR